MIEMGFSGHSEKYWLIYVVAKKQHPLFQFRGIWLGDKLTRRLIHLFLNCIGLTADFIYEVPHTLTTVLFYFKSKIYYYI
jgi:hypothetical protein